MPTVDTEELRSIIKQSVKEAIDEEFAKVRLMLSPDVSEREMADISARYGKPEKKRVRIEKLVL